MNAKRLKLYAANPRIYVILRGGLGNQLHQIAAGVALAEKTNSRVRIFGHIVDTANNVSRRGFFRKLNISGLFFPIETKETNYIENLIIRFLNRNSSNMVNKFVVSDKNFFSYRRGLPFYFIKGWFQSHEYLPNSFNPTAISEEPELINSTVTIHVRLTDFSSIDEDPLDSEYYRLAIAKVKSLKINLIFECFSDDIQGASKMLGTSEQLFFPELDKNLQPDDLLRRMSKNTYLISSRSSLSWWAAQVISAKGGTVISPWDNDVNNESWISIL